MTHTTPMPSSATAAEAGAGPMAAAAEAAAARGAANGNASANANASASASASASAGHPPQRGWWETLQSIWRELPGLVSDRVDLLSLELHRAGRALAQIVALLVGAAILGVTAWLALWAGVAVGLVELGLHWSLSLLLVLALNAGVAWLAIARLRRLLPLLRLPATRRHLTPGRYAGPTVPAGLAPAPGGHEAPAPQ